MKRTTIPVLLAAMLLAASCNKSEKEQASYSGMESKDHAEDLNAKKFEDTNLDDDSKFAVDAADGGMFEVKLGKLAKEKATTESAKKLAEHMVKDHSKANDELKVLAGKKNITLPDRLSEKLQNEYDRLSEKKGTDFDKAYIDCMVKDHKSDIAEFKKESEKGKDSEVSAWAMDKIPTLEHHLHMAKEAQEAMEKVN
jgi:putative membrane protein